MSIVGRIMSRTKFVLCPVVDKVPFLLKTWKTLGGETTSENSNKRLTILRQILDDALLHHSLKNANEAQDVNHNHLLMYLFC